MSAQPIPLERKPKTVPYVQLEHSLLFDLCAIARGGAMWTLLVGIASEANRRNLDGRIDGWTGLLRTRDAFAARGCWDRQAINQQIRAGIKLEMFERLDAERALAAGIVTAEEADQVWDGHCYRLLLANFAGLAAVERQRWEDAQREPEEEERGARQPEPKPAVTWGAQQLAAGEVKEIRLGSDGAAAIASCDLIEVVNENRGESRIDLSVNEGKLRIALQSAEIPEHGNLNCQPMQAVDPQAALPELREVIGPRCMQHCGHKAPDDLLLLASIRLNGAPIRGNFSYERFLDGQLDDFIAKRKPIKTGIFPWAARKFAETWEERRGYLADEEAALLECYGHKQRRQALQTLEFSDDPKDRAWAQHVLSDDYTPVADEGFRQWREAESAYRATKF